MLPVYTTFCAVEKIKSGRLQVYKTDVLTRPFLNKGHLDMVNGHTEVTEHIGRVHGFNILWSKFTFNPIHCNGSMFEVVPK